MSVHCEGDSWVIQQLGEKQALEFELSRLGFRHEDFALNIRREPPAAGRPTSIAQFEVRVTHIPSRRSKTYRGGLREDWVGHLKDDIASGVYGKPPVRDYTTTNPIRTAASVR
jgi:hypothetical protein